MKISPIPVIGPLPIFQRNTASTSMKAIPLYYKVSDDGISHDWIRVMKESIKNCGPIFSAWRMVKEYVKRFYATALNTGEFK